MAASPTALQGALQKVRTHGLKYSAVSVVNVIVGQGLLVLFSAVIGLRPAPSNVLAVCISAVPAYYLSRAWVWGKTGRSHLTKEVLPFWGFALAGLILSTGAVWVATHVTGIAEVPPEQRTLVEKLVPNAANILSFGVLWVMKFFILDAYMFGPHHHGPVDEPLDEGLDEPAPA
ncbi:MAG: GtrA family protein [Acidimicrobiales bacterium]|jgi:putative flippase GtrA